MRRLLGTFFVLVTLLVCSLIGGRTQAVHRRAHPGAVVATKSAWNTLRASLRAAQEADASRRTAIDEDDDDDDDEAITTSLSGRLSLDDDFANGADSGVDEAKIAVIDDTAGHDATRRRISDEGAIRASRGFGSGTERPPRQG